MAGTNTKMLTGDVKTFFCLYCSVAHLCWFRHTWQRGGGEWASDTMIAIALHSSEFVQRCPSSKRWNVEDISWSSVRDNLLRGAQRRDFTWAAACGNVGRATERNAPILFGGITLGASNNTTTGSTSPESIETFTVLPHLDGTILGACSVELAVGREGDRPDRTMVTLVDV